MHKTLTIILSALSLQVYAALPQAVKQDNFIANFYPGQNHKMPVLVLEGSGSGIPKVLAEKIAKLGHPVLALAYYKEATLPQHIESIPLEYFEPAKTWLLEKSGAKELAIVGWSKGAEAALLLATLDERIKKIVAISPSHVAWPGIVPAKTQPQSSWSLGDQPLPFVPYKANKDIRSLRDLYENSLTDKAAEQRALIDISQIQAELLLLSGGKIAFGQPRTWQKKSASRPKRAPMALAANTFIILKQGIF